MNSFALEPAAAAQRWRCAEIPGCASSLRQWSSHSASGVRTR